MKTNDNFDDHNIVKELVKVNNKLDSLFELLTDYINLITAKPEIPLTKEKAEKDFSEMKTKLLSIKKLDKSDSHQDSNMRG